MKFILTLAFIGVCLFSNAQIVSTDTASIEFYSYAVLEDIKAENNQTKSLLDVSSGEIVFSLFIEDFNFKKKLMQKHFQNKYMEIESFPRSTFKGKIQNWDSEQSQKNGTKEYTVKGELTIHGVTQQVEEPITILVKNEQFQAQSTFEVSLSDFDISIPKLMFQNIAEDIEITLTANYNDEN